MKKFMMICALGLAGNAQATVTDSFNFDSGLTGFQAFGVASHDTDHAKLVGTSTYKAGAIFMDQTRNAAKFEASFDYFIGNGNGADGLTFAWVETAGLGGLGGGLGFSGLSGYAVELDTYKNAIDANENHVAVIQNTYSNHLASATTPEMEDTGWHHIDVVFDNGEIDVFMDGTQYIDHTIVGYQAFDAYFGFTAGTGALTNDHLIDNFELKTSPVPVPAAAWLFASGLIGMVGMRRKNKAM